MEGVGDVTMGEKPRVGEVTRWELVGGNTIKKNCSFTSLQEMYLTSSHCIELFYKGKFWLRKFRL